MDELKHTLEAMEIDYYKPAIKCLRQKVLWRALSKVF